MKDFRRYFSKKKFLGAMTSSRDVTVTQSAENAFWRVSAKNEFFKKRFYTRFGSFPEKFVCIAFLAIVLKFSELFSKFQNSNHKPRNLNFRATFWTFSSNFVVDLITWTVKEFNIAHLTINQVVKCGEHIVWRVFTHI